MTDTYKFILDISVVYLTRGCSLCGQDFAIIHLDSGILFYPFAKGGLGNAVFLAELGLSLAVCGAYCILHKSISYLICSFP